MPLTSLRHPATVIGASLAPATQTAYQRIHEQLACFLRANGSSLFPVSVGDLVDFIAFRFESGCSAATLATAMSAIAYGHRLRGLPDPTVDFYVKQLLAGARRLRSSRDRRLALNIQEITRLIMAVRSMPLSPVDRAAFGAIIPLAFFALLRPGEVVISGTAEHTMRVRHVQLQPGLLTVIIPSSKTSVQPFPIQLLARPDISICPVRAMHEYMAIRGPGYPDDPFFINGRRRPLTNRDLTSVLRQAGRLAGLEETRLSGHCLRISGASHGAASGLSELQLGQAGRWSSSAVRRYVRQPVSLLHLTVANQ